MNELKDGDELEYIEDTPDVDGECAIWRLGQPHNSRSGKVLRMIVTLESGSMGWVPWAKVEFENESPMLINLLNIKLVQLRDWRL